MSVRSMKSGQFYLSDGEDIFKVRLSSGFFICGYNPTLKKSFSVWFARSISRVDFLREMLESVPWLKAESSQIIIKCVSDEKSFSDVEGVFETIHVKEIKKISRSEIGEQIYFYAKEGRLRVEKSAVVPIATLPANEKKIRVLMIDDSATILKLLKTIFEKSAEIEVVGSVDDPLKAEEAIMRLHPDVLTVDIHMDRLNGVQLLKKILPRFPIPSLLVTSLSLQDGPHVLEGLRLGAVDHIQKPNIENLDHFSLDIIEKIKMASTAKVKIPSEGAQSQPTLPSGVFAESSLIAIGASTGGTEALAYLLSQWPETIPPVLVVQHIPSQFSRAFAERLNQTLPFRVLEAEDGMPLMENTVYIAPGGRHLQLKKKETGDFYLHVYEGEAINRHCPSVDVLFRSLVPFISSKKITGVLLTGMGSDGAYGLLDLKKAGARTIAQDKESCVVFGMPKVAIEIGAVDQVLGLRQIPQALLTEPLRIKKLA